MRKKITEQEFMQFKNQIWTDFLNNATPTEIHQSVISSNFDGNKFLLDWIKDNPKVDKATMLIAYWMSAPRWKKQFKDRVEVSEKASWLLEDFDFVEEVEQKYIQNFWIESNIELDPKSDQDGYDWTSDYLDKVIVREIPQPMFQKLNGKVVQAKNFDDGLPILPIDYCQRVWDLYDEYDY